MTELTTEELQDLVGKMVSDPSKAPVKPEPAIITPDFEESTTITATGTKYSELFGWDADLTSAYRKDFIVEMFTDEDSVPAVDPNRVIDHSVMYPFVLSMQPQFKGMKTMLVGPTGSGKTTAVSHYCAKVGKGMYRINGRQDMESDTLIGRPWVGADGMEYLLGELPKALLAGKLTLIDEPWKIPSGIWMTLQRLMERGGVLQIDDMPSELEAKTIVPHANARIVLADNVVGTGDNVDKYGATLIQDGSTLNRIDLVLTVPYLKAADEHELLASKFPRLVPKNSLGDRSLRNVEMMVSLLNLLRQGYDTSELSSPASLRNIETWAEMACAVDSYEDGFRWSILNRYAEDSERSAVLSHYFTVFGKKL